MGIEILPNTISTKSRRRVKLTREQKIALDKQMRKERNKPKKRK